MKSNKLTKLNIRKPINTIPECAKKVLDRLQKELEDEEKRKNE